MVFVKFDGVYARVSDRVLSLPQVLVNTFHLVE